MREPIIPTVKALAPILIAACILLLLPLSPARAGSAKSSESSEKITIHGTYTESADGGRYFLFSGGAYIIYGDIVLHAPSIIYDSERDAYYAFGGVSATHPQVLLTCDSMYIEAENEYGFARNVRVLYKTDRENRFENLTILFESEHVFISDEGNFKAKESVVAASPFSPPDIYLDIPEITFNESGIVRAKAAVLRIIGLPVLYLPSISSGTGEGGGMPLTVDFGRTSYLGLYLRGRVKVGSLKGVGVHLVGGLFEKRGIGYGGYFDYDYGHSRGNLRAFFINDGNEGEYVENREELEYYHRSDFSLTEALDELTVTLEVHRRSDPVVHRDFFRGQWLREKNPESYVHLQQMWNHGTLAIMARPRINNHEPMLEKLPSITADLYSHRVGPGNVTFSAQSGYLRIRDPEHLYEPSAYRTAATTAYMVPYAIGDAISIVAQAGAKGAIYSDSTDGFEDSQSAPFASVTLSSRLLGDISSLGDGISRRNVILPSIRIEYVHEPSTEPFGVDIYDSSDLMYEDVSVTFVLTSVLEEKRETAGVATYRDRFLVRLENTVVFNSIARDIENDGDAFGLLNAYFKWNYSDKLFLIGDFDLDWYEFGMTTAGLRVGYNVTERLSVQWGARFIRDNPYFYDQDTTEP
ncbi:MAG: hypothetical protein U5N86_10045 [Planctomycetota bacterium]|nr:hypothetical protein [Planctomycetota bacterium]